MTSPPHFTSLPPITTRDDVVTAALSLLYPLVPHFSPGQTGIDVGATAARHDERSAQLEAFARPLWALGALLAGAASVDDAVRIFPPTTLWLTGLRHGTDPDHPHFWGWAADRDQRMVEMCPLGFALCVAPQVFWTPLADGEKRNLARWLDINARAMPNTNWLWFRVFANLALLRNAAPAGFVADVPATTAQLHRDLDHLDGFYRDAGFSNDGPAGYTQMDYYSGSFAIQLCQLVYIKLGPATAADERRKETYRERARQYALAFAHYWDDQGRGVTFGRSLTYRFAMAGFWSALAFADLEPPAPLSWGVVRGLLLRSLRWWTAQPDILTRDGLLSIGYGYPNQFMSENYNAPGSTYWFMLGFVCLAVPETHAFWQASEEPHPTTTAAAAAEAVVVPLQEPLHIMVRSGGHTFLLSSGQRCHYPVRAGESKYGKFAYSSAFAYSVPTGGYCVEAVGGDSVLALSDDYAEGGFGETWRVRRVVEDARIETPAGADSQPVLVGTWRPWRDVEVQTWLVPPPQETKGSSNWYLRVHRVKTARGLRASEGAWALHGLSDHDGRELGVLGSDGRKGEGRLERGEAALAVSRGGAVGIVELHATTQRAGKVLDEDANSNLMEKRSVLPTLAADIPAGSDVWFVTAVFGLPSTVEGWKESWKQGWETRPAIPAWVKSMMA